MVIQHAGSPDNIHVMDGFNIQATTNIASDGVLGRKTNSGRKTDAQVLGFVDFFVYIVLGVSFSLGLFTSRIQTTA